VQNAVSLFKVPALSPAHSVREMSLEHLKERYALSMQDVNARVVQACSPLRPPLVWLGHSSSSGYGRHHTQESPCICFARHSAVIVAAGHCEKHNISIHI
jgi:hypothetical protein